MVHYTSSVKLVAMDIFFLNKLLLNVLHMAPLFDNLYLDMYFLWGK